jgi:ADP-ribose pyrophosphatase YjhB (NUDIX family)
MTTAWDGRGDSYSLDIASSAAIERVAWIPGQLEFAVSTVISLSQPPDHLITSVRCVVLSGDQKLVLTDRDGTRHIVPGGRRGPGESYEDTARREVLEETGLTLQPLTPLGHLVFDHLCPMPAGYAYPYPRFIQLVYMAHSDPDVDPTCADEWAASAEFMPDADAWPLVRLGQQRLLEAARRLSLRGAP